MARSFKFSVIQLSPDPIRGESLNIGLAIFYPDGIEFRMTKKLDRVHAISGAINLDLLSLTLEKIRADDQEFRLHGSVDETTRRENVARVGPLKLSPLGSIAGGTRDEQEQRILSAMRMLVEPEISPKQAKVKRSRLISEIRKSLRRERVMASPSEGLESHRVVSNYELADGLIADLVLRNGAYHVFETVDASVDETPIRKVVSEIAVAALVLESARMRFEVTETRSKLIYSASAVMERMARPSLDAAEHQGAELINWSSSESRAKLLHSIASLAVPIERKSKTRFMKNATFGFYH